MTRRGVVVAMICAAASVAATWFALARPSRAPQHAAPANAPAEPRPISQHDAPTLDRGTTADTPAHSTRTALAPVVRARHEDGESSLTLRWKDLAPAERLRVLQDDFERAVGALEEPEIGERDQAEAQRTAEAALSAMRAELYGSERGRELHQRYEARLDRAVEARAPGG